eukprot:6914110-Alexandrium_andersonii.AAC.1
MEEAPQRPMCDTCTCHDLASVTMQNDRGSREPLPLGLQGQNTAHGAATGNPGPGLRAGKASSGAGTAGGGGLGDGLSGPLGDHHVLDGHGEHQEVGDGGGDGGAVHAIAGHALLLD